MKKISIFDRLKQHYASLPTQKRKSIVLVVVLCGLVGASSVGYQLNNNRPSKPIQDKARKQDFVLPRPDMAKESWVEKGQRELEASKRQMRDLEARLKAVEGRGMTGGGDGSTAPGNYAPGSVAERDESLKRDLAKLGVTPVEKGGDLYPPSPVKPAVTGEVRQTTAPTPFRADELGISRVPNAPAPTAPPATPFASPQQPKNIMGVFDFTKKKTDAPAPAPVDPKLVGTDGTNYSLTENFYTPGGSFFKVTLLTGLDAPSGPTSSSKPHPVLLRIQDLSWLPNELRQNVTGCFVLGESYGDLSTERALIRGLNLSCVNKENKNVLDEAIVGFVADTDGKLGMRGRVVSKQGQYLARALMASFIEGVAKGFDASANATVVTGGGVVTTNEIDSFGDGFKKGTSSGFSKAAEKMSDYYLKSAEQLYPIIEINARRHGSFIISEGKRFSFNKQILIEQRQTADKGKKNDRL